ncbi:MAG: transglycosylase [Prokaryotic dsDNA virus sp.]|nr:MAG: transglycosylase [Prokaryotic dsDNA virus sp.]|tara:strand:- start:646 stop:2829 length:2184 start_codon:yes stop_codon:yes gene_type:complete
MSANLLELQEMLRNIDMGSVQKVASGQSGKAAQLLGMDELRRRGEQMQEAKANQAEQQMQQPPMVDQYLAASQQMMGQSAPMPPQIMPAPAQQGIGSIPGAPYGPMSGGDPRAGYGHGMPPQMKSAPPRPQMNPMAPAQPPQQMPPQMMATGGAVMKAKEGPTRFAASPPKLNVSQKQGFGPLAVDFLDFLGRKDKVKDSSLKSELAAMLMMANPLREKTTSIPVTPSGINRVIELYKAGGKRDPDYYDEESQMWVRDPLKEDQLYPTPPSSLEKMLGYSDGGAVRRFDEGGRVDRMFEIYQNLSDEQRVIADNIIAKAQTLGMDPNLALAQAINESGLVPVAKSEKGARGVFQLMPGTAKDLGVEDITDIDQNIMGGLMYYGQMLNKYGNEADALAAYNAGPGAFDRYGGIPPFEETQNYARDIPLLRDRIASARAESEIPLGPSIPEGPADEGLTQAERFRRQAQEMRGGRPPETTLPFSTPTGRTTVSGIPILDMNTGRGDVPEPVDVARALPPGVFRESQMKQLPREYGSIFKERPELFNAAPGREAKVDGEGMVDATDEMFDEIVDKSRKIRVGPESSSSSETIKSGKLRPLFDMMMRSGLGLAAGENIGEAGIAGLTQATDLAQQRREDARAEAADKLRARLGESEIELNRLRGQAIGGMDASEARQAAIKELTGTDVGFLAKPDAEREALIQQAMVKYMRGGYGMPSASPLNVTPFNANY